jgi:hypothetical protein
MLKDTDLASFIESKYTLAMGSIIDDEEVSE